MKEFMNVSNLITTVMAKFPDRSFQARFLRRKSLMLGSDRCIPILSNDASTIALTTSQPSLYIQGKRDAS